MARDKTCNLMTLLKTMYLKQRNLFIVDDQLIQANEFLTAIMIRKEQLLTQKQVYWAICSQDPLYFIIDLFSVLLAKKIPVLLPNALTGTLSDLSEHYDGTLNDKDHEQSAYTQQSVLNDKKLNIDQLTLDAEQLIILFTSGSSGKPKKIIRTLANMNEELNAIEKAFGHLVIDCVFYTSVLPQHLYGLTFYILWPLITGRLIATKLINYPEQLDPYLDKKTVFISSPGLLSRMTTSVNLSEKLVILSSGGALAYPDAQMIKKLMDIDVIEIYGSSETGAIAYRCQLKNLLWQVFKDVKISQNQQSALLVASPFFMQSKNEVFVMSDQVKLVDQNHFQLLGRLDRIVKVESKRLSLDAMEQKLKLSELVADCYCLVLESYRQFTAVVIVLSDVGKLKLEANGKRAINDQLKQYLSNYFDAVLIPKKFRYVKKIPINSQSKILFNEIKQLFD
ncbi:AMP-binding protein [Thiotrichales bacterium 19X7-9]|nr:AMP-binding protein [Thiotrichales bacterium 19X7-9]